LGKGSEDKQKRNAGGLSTAQRTVKLSVASVEMTEFCGGKKQATTRTTARTTATAKTNTGVLRFAQNDKRKRGNGNGNGSRWV
jgi:hypothetical protein